MERDLGSDDLAAMKFCFLDLDLLSVVLERIELFLAHKQLAPILPVISPRGDGVPHTGCRG